MNEIINEGHGFVLENRKNLVLTGVREVIGFDEKSVEIITVLGGLSIRGENMNCYRRKISL